MRVTPYCILLLLAQLRLSGASIVEETFRTPIFERYGAVTLALPTLDEKVFVSGNFSSVRTQPRAQVARVFADGSPDLSFNATQVIYASAASALPSGGLLISGAIRDGNGEAITSVFRLNGDGSLDAGFHAVLPSDMFALAFALTPEGKVIVAGDRPPGIARLLRDGSPDPTFRIGSGFDAAIPGVAVQPDGKILAGGYFLKYNGQLCPRLARLNVDGSLDVTFQAQLDFWWFNYVTSLVLRPDGSMWVGGDLEYIYVGGDPQSSLSYRLHNVALLRPNGSVDRTFKTLFGDFSLVRSMTELSDGSLLIRGEFNSINDAFGYRCIARLTTDGSLDESFNPPCGAHAAVDSLGRILLCIAPYEQDGWLFTSVLRFTKDFAVDNSFSVLAGMPAEINAVTRQRDQKLVVTGDFRLVNGAPAPPMVRLQRNGEPDPDFDVGRGPAGVARVVELRDRKLLVGGTFPSFNYVPETSICRLEREGALDPSFEMRLWGYGNYGRNPPQIVDMAKSEDGKITLAGVFYGPPLHLMRLDESGVIDKSFAPDWNFPGYPPIYWVSSMLLDHQGFIYLGGKFSDCGIASEPCSGNRNFTAIVRFDPSGKADQSFNPSAARDRFGVAKPLAVRQDGKLLVGYRSGSRLEQLMPDGSRDPNFRSNSIAGELRSVLLLDEGRALLCGNFTAINNVPRQHIAVLGRDGSLDFNFDPGFTVDGPVNGILADQPQHWVIFGRFNSINGEPRSRIARIRAIDAVRKVSER